MEFKSFRFKADAVGDDGVFTGYASTFGNKDLGGDIVVPGAFDQWLAEWKSGEIAPLPILDNHDVNKVLGLYSEFSPDEKGLWVKGELNLETVAGAEKRALMKQGAVNAMSIGYSIYPGGYRYDSEQDAWLLGSVKLWEISLATFPMNPQARVETVKTAFARDGQPTIRDIERALREQGFGKREAKVIATTAGGTLGLREDTSRDDALSAELEEQIKQRLESLLQGA